MDKFNIYEYSGVICPGAVFIIGLYFLYDPTFQIFEIFNLTAVLIFINFSFCIGNILHGVANIIEDFIYSPRNYTERQLKKKKIKEELSQVYNLLESNNELKNIGILNRQYALMRGLSAAFLSLSIISIIKNNSCIDRLVLFLLLLISFYRAIHFVKLYTDVICDKYKFIKNKNMISRRWL